MDEVRPLFALHGHELVVRIPDEPAWVHGDSVRLAQVIGNLLHNAAKYNEPGGRVVVTVDVASAHVRISVRDNGIGLDPGSLDMIFELFSQAPAGRERAQGGLGIGLTLVKRLVELHHGSIVAHSGGSNLGSEFVCTLPKTTQDARQPARATAVATQRAIAVLADDITSTSRRPGGRARHGPHRAHGIRRSRRAQARQRVCPDVVLLDIGCRGSTG